LETKLLITEKKKEVKLAQVEARREEAKRKVPMEVLDGAEVQLFGDGADERGKMMIL
jgi:hypothetical protein